MTVIAFIGQTKRPSAGRSSSETGCVPRSDQATLPPRSWRQFQAQLRVAEVIALRVGGTGNPRQGVRALQGHGHAGIECPMANGVPAGGPPSGAAMVSVLGKVLAVAGLALALPAI